MDVEGGVGKDGAAPEDIRARRKHAKQLKKLEKKTKKEEQFLRELRKPKDTKVVLADRSFMEKLASERSKKPDKRHFEFSTSDFPELSSKKAEPVKTPASYKSIGNDSGGKGFVPLQQGISRADVMAAKVTGPPAKTEPEEPLAGGVVVNLGDLIVTKTPKKGKKHGITSGSKIRRMLESNTLSGNMLDSSNPKRSRGKHREVEKRTFTKLKLAIIKDRISSLKGKSCKSSAEDMDRDKFRLELDMYLSDLMQKLKLAKSAATKSANSTEIVPKVENAEPTKKGKSKKVTKYRKYCDNAHLEDLDKAVNALVQAIVYLQDRAFGRNPIKAKAKPRHVVGLREVKKCLMLRKVKMLIIAPDLEAQETVFNTIKELKESADAQNIPCVFALSRRQLGYVTKKFVPVSAFGILYYDGLEDKFADVKEKLKEARDKLQSSNRAPPEETNIPEKI